MKWLLNLVAVNGLISAALYPIMTLGVGQAMSWLLEFSFLVSGAGALYLLFRYRRSF